ncbi:MAG: substrate-binding and VWA domain-containing protein [Chloroflexota bacterium]
MGQPISSRNIARIVTAAYALSLVIAVLYLRPGCVHLVVWASQEKSAVLGDLARRYEQTGPSEDLRCVEIDVVRKASGEAEEALRHDAFATDTARPDVWSPAAVTWVRLLERHREVAGAPPIVPSEGGASFLQSPLVLAMPEPMAKALGWPTSEISWSEVFALAQDPRGWASRGHPEWGPFKLAKTNPHISTSGLHMLITTYRIAGSGSTDEARVRAFMQSVESSVVQNGSTVSAFLKNLADADDRGEALAYVSAIAVEEKQVCEYNQGNPEFRSSGTRLVPTIKLVPVQPRGGTFMADHPYVVLDEPWVNDQKRRAAGRFLAYLKSEPVQQELQRQGFRGARGETAPVIDCPELQPLKPLVLLSTPDPATLEQIQESWKDYRRRARVLIVMDVSRSMGDRLGSESASKLDLAKRATLSALDEFAGDDEVGLWTMAGNERRELVGIAPLREQNGLLRTEIDRLAPDGTGKALYATVSSAVGSVRQRLDRERINAVIVLTDGRNDDPSNSDLNGLVRALRLQPDSERVRVFTIAYGPGADRDALDKIALAARGARYEAVDPSVIGRAVLEAVSNF